MAKKEDIVKLAEKLMNSQENIRNIGIVAHIDHGKCISGKDRLVLSNGRIVEAKDLYNEIALSGEIVAEDEEKIVYLAREGINVPSIDKKNGKIENKPISHAWKLKGGKVARVFLENGFAVSTTPEHKYLQFDGAKFFETEAKNLKKGDWLVCARNIKTESFENVKVEFLKNISKGKFYAFLNENFAKELKRQISETGLKGFAEKNKIKERPKSFYHGLWKNRLRIETLLGIAKENNISLEKIFENITKIGLKDSAKIYLPKNFGEFYYLAGLMAGDGTSNKFVVGKPELEEEFKKICNELGFEPRKRNYAGKTKELATNQTLQKILECLFDYPSKKKSHNVKISSFLQESPDFLAAKFLRGYFDTDGCVERARNAISISSASGEMISGLKLLLPRFGVVPIVNDKKNTLYISGSSVRKFNEKIGFGLERKRKRAEEIAEKIVGSLKTDLVPCSGLKDLRQELEKSKNSVSKHYYKYENQVYAPTTNTYNQLMLQLKTKNRVQVQDLAFVRIEKTENGFEEEVFDFTVPETHNFLAEGIFIHNTTMTDNLVAASGLMSEELAGKQLFMDFYELEQERGITINSANISLVHEIGGKQFLVNVIDTPGHIDFGGEVIRAMRAVDGVIVVVDAVEGVMPQTETVIRQALRENVQPVLFLNKVDRLINELQVTEEQMQERFVKAIAQVNKLIQKNAPKEFLEKWIVKVNESSVTFGSAYNNWALNFDTMKKNNITFKQVYTHLKEGKQKELAKISPLHEAILGMVAKHLPNPVKAQGYRIPVIWSGEKESEEGKAMLSCNPKGPLTMMINDVSVDPHAGDIATGRIYSGTVKKGTIVKLIGSQKELSVQQVAVFMGPERVPVEEVPSGNIAALVGLKEVFAGETISTKKIREFESFKSSAEPVMTISVEAKNTKDLPKLIEVIRQISKEDPNIKAVVNQETGEHLLSGMGELHLEVARYRIEKDHKVPIEVSTPIVVYRETITKPSITVEGKSPNKHNKFKMHAEPIPKGVLEKLAESKLHAKVRPKDKEIVEKLIEMGFDREEAKKTWCVHNNNILVDKSRGIQALFEVKELIIQGFMDAMNEGPLAKEKGFGMKIVLEDATLHEDAIHRGPAQVLPAITRAIYACILSTDSLLLEPKQILTINVPQDFMGAASKELGARRTQITEMRTEGDTTIIIAKAPVKELIGFSAAIRGATEGRAIWTAEYYGYEVLPRDLQKTTISEIRKRKGLEPEPKSAEYFME